MLTKMFFQIWRDIGGDEIPPILEHPGNSQPKLATYRGSSQIEKGGAQNGI